jgi:hypothetical protein
MADRTDKLTITFTRYDKERGFPLAKLFGKWRQVPITTRKLGDGRIAIDGPSGYSIIVECWWLR